jgi:hypothetical protein
MKRIHQDKAGKKPIKEKINKPLLLAALNKWGAKKGYLNFTFDGRIKEEAKEE